MYCIICCNHIASITSHIIEETDKGRILYTVQTPDGIIYLHIVKLYVAESADFIRFWTRFLHYTAEISLNMVINHNKLTYGEVIQVCCCIDDSMVVT